VGAAVYLEEYADNERWFNRLIEVNIQNLAAVPSIIYGILALGIIARGLLNFGESILSGAIALGLLVLPVVIISSREAIRAVPVSIRAGSLALGATKWQTTWKMVLPNALPGMATGTILALSRAIGEAAPLILLGGLSYIQIFNYTSRPQEEFRTLASAASIVLLLLLLIMNSAAILLRNRHTRRR
jgi:phosphate transport system permease protein